MIKIGLIGAGPQADGHAKYFVQSPRSKVTVIAEPDDARGEAMATKYGARRVRDVSEMLDDVDAVVVCSPNFLHREHAVAVASAGKHLYCEKPMGLNEPDAHAIVDAVDAAGVQSVVGFSVRFTPHGHTMRQMAIRGDLGKIVSITSRRLAYFGDMSGSWRSNYSLSGGVMLEVNIHEIEWMMSIGGDLKSVYAQTWAKKPNGPRSNDSMWLNLTFAEGAVGFHEGSWLCPNVQFFRAVSGEDMGLATDEWDSVLYKSVGSKDREVIVPQPAFDLRGHFLDCIEGIAEPVCDVHWGRKVMAATDAAFESAATGKVVTIS